MQSLTDVFPPSALCVRWWTSQPLAGWSQPLGNRQCRSRSMTARRIAAGDVGGDADVEGQAVAGQPGAELAAAQVACEAAGAGEQGDGLADDLLLQDVLDVRGLSPRGGGAVAAEPVQV